MKSAKPACPVLPDVLEPGLDIVFCGTAASSASASRGAYYAGPGNAFWRTLCQVGLTPRQLAPEEFRLVTRYGLGLTDIAKNVSGNDQELPRGSFDPGRLQRVVQRYRPVLLAFTGKTAAAAFLGGRLEYGLQSRAVGATRILVLPSPSGAARRYWDESHWRALARLKAGIARRPAIPGPPASA